MADHTWSSPEVTKEVTDTEAGEMKYVCEECSAERLEVVPALENYDMDPLLEQTVDKNGEPINCKVQDPYKVLPEGVRLEIKLAEGERYDELKSQLDPTHPIENVAFFDIRLLKESNNESVDMPLARPVRVLLQIPEGWDKADMEAVLIAEDADIEFEEDIVTIDGVDYVAFWTDHFSPYAIIDELTEEEARAAATVESAESNKEADSTGKSGSVRTGDEINSYIMLEMVLFLAYVSLFVALRRRQKILLNEKK